MGEKTVRDLMRTDIPRLRSNMNLLQARNLLVRHNLSGAPVVDGLGQLVGMLSIADLKNALLDHYAKVDRRKRRFEKETEYVLAAVLEAGEALEALEIEEYMTEDPDAVEPVELLEDAAEFMQENKLHHLLVIENGILQGMLCVEDLPPRMRPQD